MGQFLSNLELRLRRQKSRYSGTALTENDPLLHARYATKQKVRLLDYLLAFQAYKYVFTELTNYKTRIAIFPIVSAV